jgi:hypothetical protein
MATNTGNDNIITTAPNLADADLTDYYSDLQNSTNYVESIIQNNDQTYVTTSEVQAASLYRDAFRQGDIISAVNNFYNSLTTYSFNDSSFSFDTILYWYIKLTNSDREIVALNNGGSVFGNKILPNLKPSVSGNMFTGFFNGLTNQLGSAIGTLGNLLGGVNNLNGEAGNGLGGLLSTISDTGTVQQSFFGNVSDSIGTLANSKYLQLDSTLPVFDVDQNYYGVPIPYSCSTDSKISNNTRNVSYNLSRLTTTLMRRNLLNIAYTIPAVESNMASDASVAHGLNLINDLPTFVNINLALPSLVTSLASNFKQPRVFQFIQFISNIGNQIAYNLRDIFPATAQDKDFTIVTSRERALASAQEAQALANEAVIGSYLEQQGINYANYYGGPNTSAGNFSAIIAAPNAISVNPEARSLSAQLNKKLNDLPDVPIYVDSKGITRVDKTAYANLISARLDGSPLIGYIPADGASYGITSTDPAISKQQWTNFIIRLGENESGFNVNSSNSADPGGSVGIQQIGPAQAVSYGGYTATTKIFDGKTYLPAVTPSQAANVKVNTGTAVSLIEQLVVPASGGAGVIGGLKYGKQGLGQTYAVGTLNKSSV